MKLIALFIIVILAFVILVNSDKRRINDEELVNKICSNCHILPTPNHLPKGIWISNIFTNIPAHQELQLPDGQFSRIKKYFIDNSPIKLQSDSIPLLITDEDFKIESELRSIHGVTSMKFFEKLDLLIVCNYKSLNDYNAYLLNVNLEIIDSIKISGVAVDIAYSAQNNLYYLTIIGKDLNQTSLSEGQVLEFEIFNNRFSNMKKVITNLSRPTKFQFIEIENKKEQYAIMLEFGLKTGKVSIWEANSGFKEIKVLGTSSGAANYQVGDFNNDNRTDIAILYSQEKEELVYYYNISHLDFRSETILKFPPYFGSSYFELIDFDNDNDQDIVICSGDNMDVSSVIKPYHGIRIYENIDGEYELFDFISLDGVYKTITSDFDGDLKLDMVAISFYPNYGDYPESGFVYISDFLNEEPILRTFQNSHLGRWMLLDTITHNDENILLIGSNTAFVDQPFLFLFKNIHEVLKSWEIENVSILKVSINDN